MLIKCACQIEFGVLLAGLRTLFKDTLEKTVTEKEHAQCSIITLPDLLEHLDVICQLMLSVHLLFMPLPQKTAHHSLYGLLGRSQLNDKLVSSIHRNQKSEEKIVSQ